MRETGNPLDVAIRGPGFLVVETPQGPRLTRAGRLIIGPDGMLRTTAGYPVLGDGGPIVIPPPTEADGPAPLAIDARGTIQREEQVFGRLRIVAAEPAALRREGGELFAVDGDAASLPSAIGTEVLQGFLEDANVNPVTAMTQLITVQRSFDALQQAVRTYKEIDDRSIRRMR